MAEGGGRNLGLPSAGSLLKWRQEPGPPSGSPRRVARVRALVPTSASVAERWVGNGAAETNMGCQCRRWQPYPASN